MGRRKRLSTQDVFLFLVATGLYEFSDFFLERGKGFSRQKKKTPVMVFVPSLGSRGEKGCLEAIDRGHG